MFILEEERQILCRDNVAELTTDGVHGVMRESAGRHQNGAEGNRPAVVGDLPLVIADYAALVEVY